MMEISINELRQGLIIKLKQTYGYKVYGDEIKQGFTEPCFFIALLEPSERQLLNIRFKRTHSFDVHFFPERSERMQERAFEIGESLYNVLNYIQVNKALYRGTGVKMKYLDEALHFFVNYDFHVFKPVAEPAMEKLFHKGALKHERISIRNKGG